jgi:hypothetical protein
MSLYSASLCSASPKHQQFDETPYYSKGKVIGFPRFLIGAPEIDSQVLTSRHGEFLKNAASWLIENRFVKEKSEAELFRLINEQMEPGGCFGECQAIALCQGKRERVEQITTAIVLQAQAKIGGIVDDAINERREKTKRLEKLYDAQKDKIFPLMAEGRLAWQILKQKQDIQKLEGFAEELNAYVNGLYREKGLEIGDEAPIENKNHIEFLKQVQRTLQSAVCDKTVTAIIAKILLKSSCGHAILLKPGQAYIHDPEYGSFGLDTIDQLMQTFIGNIKQNNPKLIVFAFVRKIDVSMQQELASDDYTEQADIECAALALRAATIGDSFKNTCRQFLLQKLASPEKEREAFCSKVMPFSYVPGFEDMLDELNKLTL